MSWWFKPFSPATALLDSRVRGNDDEKPTTRKLLNLVPALATHGDADVRQIRPLSRLALVFQGLDAEYNKIRDEMKQYNKVNRFTFCI